MHYLAALVLVCVEAMYEHEGSYNTNSLHVILDKTSVTAFHMKNKYIPKSKML